MNNSYSNNIAISTSSSKPNKEIYFYLKRLAYSINQDTLFYFLFILFTWYATNPGFLERRFFDNELLSLFGFFCFLANPVIYKKNDYIYNNVISIIVIFSMYALLSLFFYQNLYGYLRHLVIIYSIFSFFLGMKFFNVLMRIKKGDLLFISPILMTALFMIQSLYRTSYAMLLPFYLMKYTKLFKWAFLISIIAIMLVIREFVGGSTPILIVFLLLLLSVLDKKKKIIILTSSLIGLILLFLYFKPYLNLILKDGVSIYDILKMNPLLTLDGNATTRFFIWSFLFYKVFIFNCFGIGLGTSIIPKEFIWDDLMMWINDPYIEYTIGAHNSFLTILIRFGIIGVLPFIIIYWKLINDFIKDKENKKYSRLMYFYFSFFIITGCALLNVIIESPIHASQYWVALGMLYKAKEYYYHKY